MASLPRGMPAVGLKAFARLVTVFVGEERGVLGFQHVGLDREVQAAAFPQGCKALGWGAAPEELLGGRQAALFADHLHEARRVVAELTLCRLVNRDHRTVKPTF